MKVIRTGKYTFVRHWFKWYSVHQIGGGGGDEQNVFTRIKFQEEDDVQNRL